MFKLMRFFFLSILLIILSNCQKADKHQTVLSQTVTDSVKTDDGLFIHYDVKGESKTALVFVHCWSGDRTFWDNQFDLFSQNYKMVRLDIAGHGQSQAGRKNYTMELYGADVTAVVDKLGLDKVVLIGHSMGGAVICEAAKRLPGKVTALIGVDNFQSLTHKFTEEQIKGFLEPFKTDFYNTTYSFVKGMIPEHIDSALTEKICQKLASASPEAAVSSFSNLVRYDYEASFGELNIPLRSINSDRYATDIEANSKIVSDYKVEIITDIGHFLHMTKPDEFNAALKKVLTEMGI